MPATKRIQFVAAISAPVPVVFRLMLDPETYRDWTSAFCKGSYYEGSWRQGQRIRFLGRNETLICRVSSHSGQLNHLRRAKVSPFADRPEVDR